MKVYQATVVQSINSFYGELLFPKAEESIYKHLSQISLRLYEGLQQKVDCLYSEVNNYNPNFLGVSKSVLMDKEFDLSECHNTIANEFGFKSWQEVERLKATYYNIAFENAVNAIISGDIEELRKIILANPKLIGLHSQYGHEATLLHYTASNGVELWRQQVPQNLETIIGYLIEAGADKNAKMKVYGGRFTVYQLYQTSAHPKSANLAPSTADLLKI